MHYPYEKHAIPKQGVLCYNTHDKKKSEDKNLFNFKQ